LKYAYPEGDPGEIHISLKRVKRGRVEFRVADRGRGLPEGFDLEAPTSLGFKVITATVRRFGGTLSVNRLDPGTEFVITFPREIEVSEPEPGSAVAPGVIKADA
jgi:two-component sensor histidine kinase